MQNPPSASVRGARWCPCARGAAWLLPLWVTLEPPAARSPSPLNTVRAWPASSSVFIQCWRRYKIPWKKELHFYEPDRGKGENELWDEASEILRRWKKAMFCGGKLRKNVFVGAMHANVFSLSLVLNVCDATTGSYLGVMFKGTGMAKPYARIKAVMHCIGT